VLRIKQFSALAIVVRCAMVLAPGLLAQTPDVDVSWPRIYNVTDGTATLYQPQIERWDGQKLMIAWAVVSYRPMGSRAPIIGSIKFVTDTNVSTTERLVRFGSLTIAESHFPDLPVDQSERLVADLQTRIATGGQLMALDEVLTALDKEDMASVDQSGMSVDPPSIFYSTTPALLVGFDGQPVWSPIEGTNLNFAVNTNWDVIDDPAARITYLRYEDTWLQAPNINGPWTSAGMLPGGLSRLPSDDNWKEVKAHVPGRRPGPGTVPNVIITAQPAELLLLDGEPIYKPIQGTPLFWISNTDSDVFRLGRAGLFYYLVAGRWFSSADLNGPWTFATPTLPKDFRRIPTSHPRSRVLASVPGTPQALQAVLLAEMPQIARVNRVQLKAPVVSYDGPPHFQVISGTPLYYGINTDKDVIKVGGTYYLCFQAVWFTSQNPNGPWDVATSVPEVIYDIPFDSPAFKVTFVAIAQDENPRDEWVTFQYRAGYTGTLIAWGCVVWGTGSSYPPYIGNGRLSPAYYGFSPTYGLGASYNPWSGTYSRGGQAYGPYGGAGASAVYEPSNESYIRSVAAYGPRAPRAITHTWDPRTGTLAATRQSFNIYGNWGSSFVQPGDEWARTPSGSTGLANAAPLPGRKAAPKKSALPKDALTVYAGRDGNVYRRQRNGSWETWDKGGWGDVPRPVGTTGRADRGPTSVTRQLDRDFEAREQGLQRTRGFNSFRQSPSDLYAASYDAGQ